MTAKTIGIISIKGGVGKTSVVSSLGSSFANDFGKKVLLIDGNFSAPNLGLHFGQTEAKITLHDVLAGKAKIADAIYEHENGFDFIPGNLNHGKNINPMRFPDKIKSLKNDYEIIIIDSSPTLNEEILATMIASDELYVVTTPDRITLATTLRAVRLAKERKTPIKGLILNKVYGKDFEVSLEEIERASDCNVLAVIPHDLRVMESLSKEILFMDYKNNSTAEEYRKLAGAIIGQSYDGKGLWYRIKNKFISFIGRTPKQEINRMIQIID